MVSSHLANYFNKPGDGNRLPSGIKNFLRKKDPDSEVTESCYPTFNDAMRKDESDTDSDIPALVDPGENSPGGNRSDSEDVDLSLGELRDLVETHLILVDQDTWAAPSDESQDWEPGKTLDERLEGLASEHDTPAGVSPR